MFAPKHIKEKMGSMKWPELKELAVKSNHLEAFEALEEEKLEKAAKLLGEEESYEYCFQLTRHKETGRMHSNALQILEEYERFIMAKICFPEAF